MKCKDYYDVIIIGSGIAGLSAALKISDIYSVLIISKSKISDTTTFQAQGGIALPLSKTDISSHIEDTLKAGSYFNNKKIVEFIIENGFKYLKELINEGLQFDTDKKGQLLFTKEGGHSTRRILHWGGDITGQGIQAGLLKFVKQKKNVVFYENNFVSKLFKNNNRINAVEIIDTKTFNKQIINTKSVVIASGGCSGVYREHTGCDFIVGDGIALAHNVGAEIVDMEFIQFHPTTFYFPGAPRFLISEAVRGEGAYLVNNFNERFMEKYDEKNMELAPRDLVSRSILFEIINTNSSNVYLDLKNIPTDKIKKRFPNIYNFCSKYKCDITKDLIPVFPAAHYSIGGIKTNFNAETNIDGLYAAGEVACLGFHGANRLASNSLLEGVVMGIISGLSVNKYFKKCVDLMNNDFNQVCSPEKNNIHGYSINIVDFKLALRNLMWKNVGIIRDGTHLKESLNKLIKWQAYLFDIYTDDYRLQELKNMIVISEMIIKSAIWRKEVRGTHYRKDFPKQYDRYNTHLVHKNCSQYEVED